MTTQEYVKKEAELITESALPGNMETESGMIAKTWYMSGAYNGLSAGIELAKAFALWIDDTGFTYNAKKEGWVGMDEPCTTSELFEIFLNESNEK